MNHWVLIATLSILLSASGDMTTPVRVSTEAARLAAPVLNAAMKVFGADNEETRSSLERPLNRIFRRHDRAANEALAVVAYFYVGEHPDEDITCELIHRGKRVLPFLSKYDGRKILIPGVDMTRTQRHELFPTVLEEIRAGNDCHREP